MIAGAALSIEIDSEDQRLALRGVASIQDAQRLRDAIGGLPANEVWRFDLDGLEAMDTAAAHVLVTAKARAIAAGGARHFLGVSPQAQSLLDRVDQSASPPVDRMIHRASLTGYLGKIGAWVVRGLKDVTEWFGIFGLFLARLVRAIAHPREFRLTSLVHNIQEVGLKAVPIVALMAFLIGVVLAFQGAAQLRQFGAEVFVVDLIAISILRELGILLTAIIVAGRTASAFTAAIGSMKMREEIDAMRTLAIDPGQALIVPRILALLISLPILGLIADVAGLLGGALMAWVELGISPGMFQTRLLEGTDIRHIWVGLVKAPVFAVIIGVIGCWAGLKVERDAESLGRMTSSAVVAAIFAVIVADAVFSIFFAQIGI